MKNKIIKISNEDEYKQALKVIEILMDLNDCSPLMFLLENLAIMVQEYEDTTYPMS